MHRIFSLVKALSPCVGQPCCGRPTSLWPSGAIDRSRSSDWPRKPPFYHEPAASDWGFAGARREPMTPSPPVKKKRLAFTHVPKHTSNPQLQTSSFQWCPIFIWPPNLCTVPPPHIPVGHRLAGRGAVESWRFSPRRGSSWLRRTAWRRTRWARCAPGQMVAGTPESHREIRLIIIAWHTGHVHFSSLFHSCVSVCSVEAGAGEKCSDTDLLSLCLRLLPDGVEIFEQIWPHLLLVTWDKWKHTVIWAAWWGSHSTNWVETWYTQQDVAASNWSVSS